VRKGVILVLAAALVLLVAAPAEALQKSKRGIDYAHQGGSCEFKTAAWRAVVACGIGHRHCVYYWCSICRTMRAAPM